MSGHLDQALRDEIVSRYGAGEGTVALSRELGLHPETIRINLIRAGVERRHRRHLTPPEKAAIGGRYVAGENSRALAAAYGVSDVSILNALRQAKIPSRDPASARRTYPLDECAFAKPTPEALYWAGFLMADGCVSDEGRILCGLKCSDWGHLDKLRRFVSSPTKPLRMTDVSVTLTLDSRPIACDLARYGVIPRKSLIAEAREMAATSPAFWLGVFDGDGTLSPFASRNKHPYPVVRMCGAPKLMRQFNAFAHSLCPEYARPPISKRGSLSFVTVSGWRARELLRTMHADSPVSLDRKRLLAEIAFAYVSKAERRRPS